MGKESRRETALCREPADVFSPCVFLTEQLPFGRAEPAILFGSSPVLEPPGEAG